MRGRRQALAPEPSLGDSLRLVQAEAGLSEEALLEVVAAAVRQAWLEERGWEPRITASLEQPAGTLLIGVGGPLEEGAETATVPVPGVAAAVPATVAEADPRPLAELPPEVFQRASRLARARLSRWLREIHEHKLTGEAEEHRGQLVDSIVERIQDGTWYLRAGDLQAVLAPVEQIPGERLRRGQHLKVVLMEARRAGGGEYLQVRASRTSPLLLRRLMEAEVPELADGTLAVRGVAREPGGRAKVAVESQSSEIDAKGACIGLRGVRIRAVVAQLGGEKVDVIEWAPDPAEYVARALAPAPITAVRIDSESHRATVIVAPEMLSLAIGREGQNARLAARLTGWRIDIHPGDGSETAAPRTAAALGHAG
ncbi:MAG: transcription termination/antitermination protein NusA, partial [Candidatus Dormibacteria bacterium]